MKHPLLFTILLLAGSPLQAGWFFNDPPDYTPEYKAKIAALEGHLSEQRKTTDRWEIAAGSLALGGVLLFVIGTALGAKTRQSHDATRRLGRAVPTTSKPTPAPNGAKHHLGETDPPDRRSTLAA